MNPITLDDAIDTIQGVIWAANNVDHKLECWQADGEARYCAWIDRGDDSAAEEIGSGPTMRAAIVDLARKFAKRR